MEENSTLKGDNGRLQSERNIVQVSLDETNNKIAIKQLELAGFDTKIDEAKEELGKVYSDIQIKTESLLAIKQE